DWSSDVCSSDLTHEPRPGVRPRSHSIADTQPRHYRAAAHKRTPLRQMLAAGMRFATLGARETTARPAMFANSSAGCCYCSACCGLLVVVLLVESSDPFRRFAHKPECPFPGRVYRLPRYIHRFQAVIARVESIGGHSIGGHIRPGGTNSTLACENDCAWVIDAVLCPRTALRAEPPQMRGKL